MVQTVKTKDLLVILEQVQAQLAAISERVERLETAGTIQPLEEIAPAAATAAPAAAEPPLPEPVKPEITEEELLAISAALGAYLGYRVRIRQIRLLSSRAWAQQGRVSIQASHNLHN